MIFATNSDSERFTSKYNYMYVQNGEPSTLVFKDLFSVWSSSFQPHFPYEMHNIF